MSIIALTGTAFLVGSTWQAYQHRVPLLMEIVKYGIEKEHWKLTDWAMLNIHEATDKMVNASQGQNEIQIELVTMAPDSNIYGMFSQGSAISLFGDLSVVSGTERRPAKFYVD